MQMQMHPETLCVMSNTVHPEYRSTFAVPELHVLGCAVPQPEVKRKHTSSSGENDGFVLGGT